MDLSERTELGTRRHPWETARVQAIQQIIAGLGLVAPRVLDVGAGDGYLIHALHVALGFRESVAQDIHLSEELARELCRPGVEFVRDLTDLKYQADLILLLDVLEHVPEPVALLSTLVRERLAPGGRLLITVPAFQPLYTEHDRALEHVRRYSRSEIVEQVSSAGVRVSQSGYLFASLLVPRAASALRERLAPARNGAGAQGIGRRRGGPRLTRWLHSALVLDNRLCLAASERGLTLPGLTVWLSCTAS